MGGKRRLKKAKMEQQARRAANASSDSRTIPDPERQRAPLNYTNIVVAIVAFFVGLAGYIKANAREVSEEMKAIEYTRKTLNGAAMHSVREKLVGDMRARFDHFVAKVASAPTDSNSLATLGNLIVSHTENRLRRETSDVALNAAKLKDLEDGASVDMILASYVFFEEAIRLDRHFGALYSRALTLKLYPDLLYRDYFNAAEHAKQELCESQNQTLIAAVRDGRKKVPALLADSVSHCAPGGVHILSNWSSPSALESVELTPLLQTAEGKMFAEEEGVWASNDFSLARIRKRTTGPPIVVQGMDAIIHNIPIFRSGASNREPSQCIVYQSNCYAALWRQFERQQVTAAPRHFGQLATVAHFSGGQYYHWLADGLPRLIALAEALHNGTVAQPLVPLLLPALRGGGRFIEESVELVMAAFPNSWPFSSLVYHDASSPTTTNELLVTHWPPLGSPGGAILAPPPVLRRVREVLLGPGVDAPPPHSLVFVARGPSESRFLVNEGQVEGALKAIAVKANLRYMKFDGQQAGVRGALKVFPTASLVVGVHGAGLTNVMFCSPGSALLEIALPEPEFGEYRHIAAAMGLAYTAVKYQHSSFESNIHVNTDAITRKALEILGQTLSSEEEQAKAVQTTRSEANAFHSPLEEDFVMDVHRKVRDQSRFLILDLLDESKV